MLTSIRGAQKFSKITNFYQYQTSTGCLFATKPLIHYKLGRLGIHKDA